MAMRLAEEMPDRIAAIGLIAASMPAHSECIAATTPVSALFMHGTNDPFAPYEGGPMVSDRGEILSIDESVAYWVARNGTDVDPVIETLTDSDPDEGSTVETARYSNGTNGTEVMRYKVIEGGHTEPSIQERYSNLVKSVLKEQNGDIEMAEEVWAFFATQSK